MLNEKLFKLHWLDGKKQLIKGNNIQDAFIKSGFGGGITRALDYWEEIKLLPYEQKILLHNGDEIQNKAFIDLIKNKGELQKGDIIELNLYNILFKWTVDNITGLYINFIDYKTV